MSLETWRIARALQAQAINPDKGNLDIFLDQELLNHLAIARLGIDTSASPSAAKGVGSIWLNVDAMKNLRVPYAVEIMGMPGAGKSTMIKRYLQELWGEKSRHQVALINEGARTIKDDYGSLRYTDPFLYSSLAGTATFTDYVRAIAEIRHGAHLIMADRGQVDRQVFRRTLFTLGHVSPSIMRDESEFINGLENTPVQIGALVLFMVRPEVSMRRNDYYDHPGPVGNIRFLTTLYEQYWRMHSELLDADQTTYRLYECIDAEMGQEEVYERFKYLMDWALNLPYWWAFTLARSLPEEFDRIQKEFLQNPHRSQAEAQWSKKLGKKVLIVGGDDMESPDDMLDRQSVEVISLSPAEAGKLPGVQTTTLSEFMHMLRNNQLCRRLND